MTELISHFQKDNKPSTIFILMKTQNSFQPSMQNMGQSNCGSAKNNQTASYDITADCNKQILQSIHSHFSREILLNSSMAFYGCLSPALEAEVLAPVSI